MGFRIGAGVAAAGLIAAPLGWTVTERLESHNEFCVACHLEPEAPLHQTKALEFESIPAANLAAAHRAAREEFRCIECHGGVSFAGRLRVKVVSARDALRYVIGRFSEPEEMRHPLWDEDCVQCHATYRAERDDAFHAIDAHNVDFPNPCVECHEVHVGTAGGVHFLARETVLPVCRNCHEEF